MSGLRGAPVGILALANALLAKTLKPCFGTSSPAAVMSPHSIRSRLVSWPWEKALTISARFFRAFCASFHRAFDAFSGRYITLLPLYYLRASLKHTATRHDFAAMASAAVRAQHVRAARRQRSAGKTEPHGIGRPRALQGC